MVKKILIILGISIAVLFVLAIGLPFVFSGKIKDLARKEMNKNLNAKSGFSDVSLSLFRHFPQVSVGLDQLYITGPGDFAKDTLIAANRIDVAVNLFSLIGSGPMEITHIVLDQPRIHAMVDKDGKVNWDITKPDTDTAGSTAAGEPFHINLKKYSISDGSIRYDDEQGNMHLALNGLDHEGSGNFSADNFLLKTTTRIGRSDFSMEGIPYLNNTRADLDADFDIKSAESLYSFSRAKLTLNEMEVNADGSFQLVNDSTYKMDIRFNTPSNDFKNILSLVPAVYQRDFKDLKTKGKAAFEGMVKGMYDGHQMPAYDVKATIKDGFFQYPDLPKPVQNINLDLHASNSDGQMDNTVIDISQASLSFGNDPFSFRVLYKNPETVQYIDAAAKGKLDLGTIGQFIKLDKGTRIGGIVNADINAKGNLNVVLQQKPGPFEAKGLLDIANALYASSEFPQPIKNANARIDINSPDGVPDHTVVNISNGHLEFGADPVDFSLLLTNPASDPAFNGKVKGSFQLERVKQFYSFAPGTSLDGKLNADISFKGKKSMVDKSQYDAIQTAGTVLVRDVVYKSKEYPDGLQLKQADLNFTPSTIRVPAATGSFNGTHFDASGTIDNAIGYALKDEPLAARLQFNADKIDLNKWMGQPEAGTAPADSAGTAPTPVPANLNVVLQAAIGELLYDKVSYSNVKGQVKIANEAVSLQNLTMNALGGSIGLSGAYSTKESKLKPDINFQYQLANLDVEQTFKAFNTVKYLMPVGQFISGKLNSSLVLTGKLGDDMMPQLPSLTGNGNLLVIDGFLSKFKPLEELASKFQLSDLEKISVKDIKAYFEFVKGKVMVKPFKVKVADIEMEIGGMHGLDQSIDYLINMKVPRAKLGSQANQLVDGLAADLAKKGLPVKLGETVNIKVNMGGSITQPKLQYNLQSSGASLAEEVKSKADSVITVAKNEIKDSLQSIKKQAVKDVEKAITDQLFGKKDTTAAQGQEPATPKKAEEAAKGILNNLLKKKKNNADSTQKQ